MKKTLSISLAIVGLFIGVLAVPATAIQTDSVTIDYCGNGCYLGETYKEIIGQRWLDAFNIPFVLDSIPSGSLLTGGTLSITHVGNVATKILFLKNPSDWDVSLDGVCIGELSESPYGAWKTDTFSLDQEIVSCLVDSKPLSCVASLKNTTLLPDCLKLDKACLSVNYTSDLDGDDHIIDGAPVPEPGSMMLLLSGLTGLAGLGIRKAALFR